MSAQRMKKHAPAFLVLALLVFVFFYDIWLLGLTWFDSAGLYLFFPWRMESNYSISDVAILWGPYEGIPYQFYLVKTLFHSLHFPLWNPLTLGGVPFFASSHKQVLDLTNFVYFFLGLPQAIHLQVTLQVLLLGIFGYLLAYQWTNDKRAALICAVAYAFSCHVISKTFWAPNIGDFMWVPLAILFGNKGAQTGETRYFIFFGMILSAIFLGGSDNYLPMLLTYLGVFLIFEMGAAVRRGEWTGGLPRAICLTILPFALFVGLSAIRLFPYAENMALSDRAMPHPITPWVLSGANLYETIKVTLYSLFNLFAPVKKSIFFRTDMPNSFFLGVAGILLILPCAKRLATGRSAFFFWAAVSSIILASLGDSIVLWVTQIPGLKQFPWLLQSVVSRVDRVATLYMAGTPLLLALGYMELKKDSEEGHLSRWIKWYGAVAAGIVLWLLSSRVSWMDTLTRINSYYGFTVSLIAVLILTGALVLRSKARISSNFLAGIILLFLFFELFLGTRAIFTPSPREEFYPEMPSLKFLKSRPGLFRVGQIIAHDKKLHHYSPILIGNLLMPFNIQSITGYQGILPRRHHKLFKAMTIPPESDSGKPTFFYNFVELKPHSLRGPLLDLFNVKYVLFSVDDYTTQLRSDRYRLVYSNEIRIYENLDVMPRAFVVHQSKVIQDEDEIIRQMNSDSFDPRRTVILEEEDGLSKAGGPEAAASENTEITIRRYEANRVVVDATLDTSGFLVLTDSYHPGWRVKVDGRPAPLLKANYLFRAVRLEAGTHQVEFIYSPKSFRIGVFVSLGTLIAALCVLSLPRVRRGGAKS